jgi:hypothetical protein
MQYRWHPFFGKMFDIHQHFSKARIEVYRCCPSGQSGQRRLDMPVWMFDPIRCSKMELSDQPYCSLNSLQQLLVLLSEASSAECIIGQRQDTLHKQGDANAQLRPSAKDSRHASVRTQGSASENMGKSIQGAMESGDSSNEQDGNGVSPSGSTRR